jgi:hypothetical protein
MISITDKESAIILEMLFEHPEKQDARKQARMIQGTPKAIEDLIRYAAGDDRNILLTLVAVMCCVGLTVPEGDRFAALSNILITAALVDKKILKEVCEADIPVRLGTLQSYLAEEFETAHFVNDEPVGNC